MMKKNFLTSGILLLLLSLQSFAGTVTGSVQNPSGGLVANGTFTFQLTQAAVVSGSALVVASSASCYTDQNGAVVGEPNPLVVPVLSVNLASGTLPAGTYWVRLTYFDTTGESFPGPETSINLAAPGTLNVIAPIKQPGNASGFKIYIGTASGNETLQGSITGTPGSWGNFAQSAALAAGAALPGSNTTACKLRFNDELQPSFVCYDVGFTSQSGASVSGFPQIWYLSGGSAGTVNISLGTPQSNVCQGSGVFYPQAIMATPPFNATQSINGGLNLNGFSLTAGGVVIPAGGVECWNSDSGISRIAAVVFGFGTCVSGNASGTTRQAIVQLGGSDTGLSRDSAGIIDVGNGTQGDTSGSLKATAFVSAAANPAASGILRVANNVAAITARNVGANGDFGLIKLGTDNLTHLIGGGADLTAPLATDTLVGKATTDTLTNKTYGGITLSKQAFTGSGTFTIPANITSVKVTVVGGGGAGGGATAGNNGGGGGSGAVAIKWLSGLTPGNTITVTVGAGGTGVSGASGNNGNSSSIASGTQVITTVTAPGGSGGSSAVNAGSGTGAAVATNGDVNSGGTSGGTGTGTFGGGIGASGPFGGGAAGAGASLAGNPATGNGAGGGGAGAGANNAGGTGGVGLVLFEWIT